MAMYTIISIHVYACRAGVDQPATDQQAQLDINTLDQSVHHYMDALAPSTRRTYSAAQKRYIKFCELYVLTPLPLNVATLCKFIAYLADSDILYKSIKCYLSGTFRSLPVSQSLRA